MYRGDRCNSFRIGIVDGDGLILIAKVSHHAFGEHVERPAQEYVVCGPTDDVYLHVESKASDQERYVAS